MPPAYLLYHTNVCSCQSDMYWKQLGRSTSLSINTLLVSIHSNYISLPIHVYYIRYQSEPDPTVMSASSSPSTIVVTFSSLTIDNRSRVPKPVWHDLSISPEKWKRHYLLRLPYTRTVPLNWGVSYTTYKYFLQLVLNHKCNNIVCRLQSPFVE